MPTQPNKDLLDRLDKIPTITLDGQEWPVPKLAPAQNEVAVPIILEMWPMIMSIEGAPDKLDAMGTILSGERLKKVYDCIFVALKRGHKELTREEFDDDMAIGILEAFEALMVIGRQTGLIKLASVQPGGTTSGEAAAPSSQTGG